MARVQAAYRPQGTGLQSSPLPTVSTVAPQFDTPQEDSATRLARALGVLDAGAIGRDLQTIQDTGRKDDVQQATAFANSMTLDELGKRIKSGDMLPSQSPVFLATLQHIYGENTQKGIQRDTLSGLTTGQLQFQNPQDLEKYLIDKRNEALTGQSKYTVAGFDKGWGGFMSQAQNANVQINDASAVKAAIATSSDNLGNVLLDVTGANFKGTPDDAAKALMQRYELLSGTQLLRDDSRKAALGDLMVRIAGSGNTQLLNSMLSQKLPNNGPTVSAFLGDRTSLALSNRAEVEYDKAQRQRVDVELGPFLTAADSGQLNIDQLQKWKDANEKYVTSPTVEALINRNREAQIRQDKLNLQHQSIMQAQQITMDMTQYANTLVSQRRGYQMPDFQVPTPDGSLKTVKGADLVAGEVERRIAANPQMTFDEQVRLYANNGVENKQWKASLNAAYANIGEVGVDAKGKPVGELLPATLEGLNQFSVINQISTGYARELAGGDRQYQSLLNIQALRESGVNDPNLAASLVNQADRNTAKNIESITTKVNSAVNDITNPGVFTGRFWGEVFSGEWGNGEKNLRVVRGAVSSLAKAYMAANVASTGEEAVKKAVEYYANPAISTQINNTIYFNKDLPRVPQNQDQREWFKRFMDTQVSDYLKGKGITYNSDDIVLQPMLGGEPRYMVNLKGTPIGKEFLRRDVEKWIQDQNTKDIHDAVQARNGQGTSDRMFVDSPGGAAFGPIKKPPSDFYERNKNYAKPAPPEGYLTKLSPEDEQKFQEWVKNNDIPFDPSPKADYDMRGFWKSLQTKDGHASTGIDPNDGKLHFTDYFKTPYHETFSRESKWATKDAPEWNNKDQLVDKNGKVIFDDRAVNKKK